MRRKEKVAYWVNCGALQLCTTQKHVVLLCSHQSDAVVQKRQLCGVYRFAGNESNKQLLGFPQHWPIDFAEWCCAMVLWRHTIICAGGSLQPNCLQPNCIIMLQAINMTKTLCMDLVQRGSRDAKPLHLDGIFASTNNTLCHLMPSERQRNI